ncbi:DMT family transporter [Brevibacillus laterosporus]|uniref:DMT family transporter n=1 Tax=Brevibacillus laterosporus TaxID=1465 RepID=UPI0018CF25AC|nr:DMT family transporter [Brevibacillus laterosporus]MBG9797197.1 membrane protein [Brevibacillus laterosporus]MCR8937250.1 DMT family transporter [Brevibacillus laterosporus]MCZ0839889.1 DMT family transporter [Brevibacillus laterosporus]MCZ0845025.1 DMT family transporter [Brevibacillus laterosporus]MED1911995.1 DMT family transporter [Brevibacillus laterosporus]
MILGIVLVLIAGSLVGLQNIFNGKVNERVGSWTTTTLVLGMGFVASLTMGFIFEGGHIFTLQNMKTWYWFSGLIGVGVVICLVQGIRLLGPTYAISIVVTSQLGFALLWDSLGWFGLDKVPFTFRQLIGVLVIVCGVILFKLGNGCEKQVAGDSQHSVR